MGIPDEASEPSEPSETSTAGEAPPAPLRSAGSPARLEAFSDGVLAVIITITVLDIRPPNGFELLNLRQQLSLLLVYPLSFAFVGIYWNNHHHLLRATRSISSNVMWANLHLLFWLSLVPVSTAWAGASHLEKILPAFIYGGIGLMAGVAYFILTRAIIQANKDTGIKETLGNDIKGKASPGLYIAGMLVALVFPQGSYLIYAAVAVMWFIPDRRLVRS